MTRAKKGAAEAAPFFLCRGRSPCAGAGIFAKKRACSARELGAVVAAAKEAHHDAGKFRTGRGVSRTERAVLKALEDALLDRPGDRVLRVCADAGGIAGAKE